MDIDSDLIPFRTDLRTKNEDYDQYALSFLDKMNRKNTENLLKFFPFFSAEIQNVVIDCIFNRINNLFENNQTLECKPMSFFLEIIQILCSEDYFKMNDISQYIIQLINKSFRSNLSLEIQQCILDTFSVFISTHNEFKNSDFYEVVPDLIQYYDSSINLFPLFISLIANPPFPSEQLIESIVTMIYNNSYEKKYTINAFHFFELCLKNDLEVNYDPFLQQVQYFLSSEDELIYSSFLDFLIVFPEAKPDMIDSLLEFENQIKKSKIKAKIFFIFNRPKYFKIWKETNAEEITQCSLKNMKSRNPILRTYAIISYLSYQNIPEILYDDEIAHILLDNYENPLLTEPVSNLLYRWLCDIEMDDDTKMQLFQTINGEYDNLKVVLNLNIDKPNNSLYLALESIIDTIYNFGIDEAS